MNSIARPIRIEKAFDDPGRIRALFRNNGPYGCLGVTVPDGVDPQSENDEDASAMPWFRGNWAIDGEPLAEGAETILFNPKFIDAAHRAFGANVVRPMTVGVNLNAPMVSGVPHVDVPAFRGATRATYPLRLLAVMGECGLFERWRVVEAGAVFWIYDGPGGEFDYWPNGIDANPVTEGPPFGNVAILADNNRMYHRVRAIGSESETPLRVAKNARMEPAPDGEWAIYEEEKLVGVFANEAVRLSVLWKAEIFTDEVEQAASAEDKLTPELVMEIFSEDLHARGQTNSGEPDITDETWIAALQRSYYTTSAAGRL